MYSYVEKNNAAPCGAAHQEPARSLHSYSVCKNRMSESGARNCRILVSGASKCARAFLGEPVNTAESRESDVTHSGRLIWDRQWAQLPKLCIEHR